MRNAKFVLLGLFACSALGLGACKKSNSADTHGPVASPASRVEVETVEVGTALGAGKTIADPKDTFRPTDMIYVSVKTKGSAPEATLTARFKYGADQVVKESSQRIVPSGAVATEFHVQKSDGWPEGKYHVDILLDGRQVASKEYEIEAGT